MTFQFENGTETLVKIHVTLQNYICTYMNTFLRCFRSFQHFHLSHFALRTRGFSNCFLPRCPRYQTSSIVKSSSKNTRKNKIQHPLGFSAFPNVPTPPPPPPPGHHHRLRRREGGGGLKSYPYITACFVGICFSLREV